MEQLKLLMDYTKFHIGLTIGVAGIGFIRAGKLGIEEMLPGVSMIFFAGAAGGVIASSIPEHSSWGAFKLKKLEIFGLKTFPYCVWSKIEHYSFWAAIIVTGCTILNRLRLPNRANS